MTDGARKPLTVLVWGTYDTSKPRNRILIRGLRDAGAEVIEIHRPIWEDVKDKGHLSSRSRWLTLGAKWMLSYPSLLWRYSRSGRHDVVLIGYAGHLDVVVLWLAARARGTPVVWDQFISLYDTVVRDRALLPEGHPVARVLHAWEWLACRSATRVLMDTRAHAAYVEREYGLAANSVQCVPVGVEDEHFEPLSAPAPDEGQPFTIVFYGQFIPLHGIETIIRAAVLAEGRGWRWIVIGTGQEDKRIAAILAEHWPEGLTRIPWVEYEELVRYIASADVCLGIFGASEKAANVIPHKVYQILCAGRPLVTRDSPAIRELLTDDGAGVRLVPPADPDALLGALDDLAARRAELRRRRWHADTLSRISPLGVGRALLEVLETVARER